MRRHSLVVALSGLCLFAQFASAENYTFRHFAGTTGGPSFEDGTPTTAHFNRPYSVAVDQAGNVYVADTENDTIRKVSTDGLVATLAGLAGISGRADGIGSEARFDRPRGLAIDKDGNLFVADTASCTIRKITPNGDTTLFAGWNRGSSDGLGPEASFDEPWGIAVDTSGNLYVSDSMNHTIRKITPDGVVTTLAGSAGMYGSADGTGSAARFLVPYGVATDSAANVYVADSGNHTIRKITPDGVVTTFAGTAGVSGSTDGDGTAARFYHPCDVATDADGNVYVADTGNHTIRKITPDGVVTTVAGLPRYAGSVDATGNVARFSEPTGLYADAAGNIYVADTGNHSVRKVGPGGVVTTVAGIAVTSGHIDAAGDDARFDLPRGVARDSAGNLYVADSNSHTIRKVTPERVVTTLAGTAWKAGSADGIGAEASFSTPSGIAVDTNGNVYVSDWGNATIRKITADGVVSTLAGLAGVGGSEDGAGSSARFLSPAGLAVDDLGNVIVADAANQTLRKITPAGVVTTFCGAAGQPGAADGNGGAARFDSPAGVVIDKDGNVFVTDAGNNTIRKVTPAGDVTTVAGSPGKTGADDGFANLARFNNPNAITIDGVGNLYVADTANDTIRKITPSADVVTLGGVAGYQGSRDGVGGEASFTHPSGIASDPAGTIFIGDPENGAIRIGQPLLDDAAVIDSPTGTRGALRQLDAYPQTASSYEWAIVRRPAGSVAQLSLTEGAAPTFKPDAADLYVFRLVASGPTRAKVSSVSLKASGNCDPAVATVSGSGTMCAGGSHQITAALSGIAPFAITWSDGFVQTAIASSPATRVVTPEATTTYSITSFTDACGAGTAAGDATVTVLPLPHATVSGSAVIQLGSTAQVRADLTGTAPWTITWSDGYVETVSNATSTRIVKPSGNTNYIVTSVVDANCVGISQGSASITVAGAPTIGENGLANSGFDSDIAFWCVGQQGCQWSPVDGFNSNSSGSLVVENVASSANTTRYASGCADIAGIDAIAIGGRSMIPPGQQDSGSVSVTVAWLPLAGCGGTTLSSEPGVWLNATADGTWRLFQKRFTPPAGANSLMFSVGVTKTEAGGAFEASVDEAFAGPIAADPASGRLTGGEPVTVRGTGFQDGATVTFGGVEATSVTFVSANKVVAVTAAHGTGAVDIVLTNPDGGVATSRSAFTFSAPGDVNANGTTDAADIFALLNYLLGGGIEPNGVADANGDGNVNMTDVFYLINFVFGAGGIPR